MPKSRQERKKINENNEFIFITKCIIKGMTRAQIAQELFCSRSAVSYKMVKLFKKYKVKNRLEFTVKILSDIIEKYNQLTIEKSQKITILEQKLKNDN